MTCLPKVPPNPVFSKPTQTKTEAGYNTKGHLFCFHLKAWEAVSEEEPFLREDDRTLTKISGSQLGVNVVSKVQPSRPRLKALETALNYGQERVN